MGSKGPDLSWCWQSGASGTHSGSAFILLAVLLAACHFSPVRQPDDPAATTAARVGATLTSFASAPTRAPADTPAPPPEPVPTATPTEIAATYVVQEGDTLIGIADRLGVDYLDLARVNGLTEPYTIQAGWVLNLPLPADEDAGGAAATPGGQPAPAAETPTPSVAADGYWTLGYSAGNRPIEAYQFGQGPLKVALIGGIHGGYEWNTILLAYEIADHFSAHPEAVPASFTVFIIPSANPDGQHAATGHVGRFSPADVLTDTVPGRFNANGVDLNRNWDCDWEPTGVWRQQEISAGGAPFSEVENQILRDFLLESQIHAVVFWHSQLPGVFAGHCGEVSLPLAVILAKDYATAAGYPYEETFTSYAVTGDAADWLALMDIPAIEVEFTDHFNTEFARNLAGVQALLRSLDQLSSTPTPQPEFR